MKLIITLILLCLQMIEAKELTLTPTDIQTINNSPQKNFIIKRFQAYESMRDEVKEYPLIKKLAHVNTFFNRILPVHDETKYSADDYWATRKEFLINGQGDCEDYVIAKYFTLSELGVEKRNLYFAVVQVQGKTTYHMVLLYKQKNTFYVMDNLSFRTLPLTKRVDLKPMVAFNEFDSRILKRDSLGQKTKINWGKVDKWEELLERVYINNE